MSFDPNRFKNRLNDYIAIADGEFDAKYASELENLKGLTDEQISAFSGTTEQLDDIIAEVEKAKASNLAQAQLIANVKDLGESTYELARKVSDLIP